MAGERLAARDPPFDKEFAPDHAIVEPQGYTRMQRALGLARSILGLEKKIGISDWFDVF